MLLRVGLGVLGVAAIVAAVWFLPILHVAKLGEDSASRLKLEIQSRAVLVQVIGGLALFIGLFATWSTVRSTWETVNADRQKKLTDRLALALEQLASESTSGKAGGLYMLDAIAADDAAQRTTATNLVVSHVRDSREVLKAPPPAMLEAKILLLGDKPEGVWIIPSRDRQVALSLLANWRHRHGVETEFDLRWADLRGGNFGAGDFSKSLLNLSDLRGALLSNARFNDSKILWVNAEGAYGTDAVFDNATIQESNFSGSFHRASFRGAGCYMVSFKKALLIEADFGGAALLACSFDNAVAFDVDFSGASVAGASFAGADLSRANLSNINGWEDILSVKGANIYGVTDPPEGFVDWALAQGAVANE